MGNFSRSTFDPKKHYVSVRLQQGVPLVDADWNEMEDIRQHEFETFLKSIVGAGVPAHDTGFQIQAVDSDNDFLIKAGMCIVNGQIVVNEQDLHYSEQQLEFLSPPSHSNIRTDLVYLDVWEEEITSANDPTLINPAIGIETCVRIERKWAVRVSVGSEILPDPPPDGHAQYALAILTRRKDKPRIGKADISDQRRTGLMVLPEGITIKNGNVGIGTTDPEQRLQITGSFVVCGDGKTGVGTTAPTNKLDVKGAAVIGTAYAGSQTAPANGLLVQGAVGIGVNNPQATLHVEGNARVKNSLIVSKSEEDYVMFTNLEYDNEDEFPTNNLKLRMANRFIEMVNQPPVNPYEFVIGHTESRPVPLGQIPPSSFRKVFSVTQDGTVRATQFLTMAGSKPGYVVDYFVNATGDVLEQGDIVVLAEAPLKYWASGNDIPIPEVDLTDQAYDIRVCGIVARVVSENELPFVETSSQTQAQQTPKSHQRKAQTPEDIANERQVNPAHPFRSLAAKSDEMVDRTQVKTKQMGMLVTLGAYSYCKVDADIAPIQVGDLLTTSPTRGHAQKALDRTKAIGAILGKALAPLEKGKAKIPVLVLLQ